MKKSLTLVLLLLLIGCSSDSNRGYSLPPETQTGANTFGVTINGKVYVPRDPTGGGTNPSGHGMKYKIDTTLPWSEIAVVDGASAVGFKMAIHFKELLPNITSVLPLKTSNFHDGIDSTPVNQIFFKIWDNNISNYAYYGSLENQGEINVKKNNGSPNWILSGTFQGKFVRYDNPNAFITITDGRFDLNLNTLPNTTFP